MRVEGSVVLVTGANRGIGKSYVEEFLKQGAQKIYLGVRNLDSVEELVNQDPEKLVPLKLDVTNINDITEASQKAQDVNILVNNAGVLFFDDINSSDLIENTRKHMEVNLIGPMLLTQKFAPILKKNGGGANVIVSSIAGHVSMPLITSYCASKFAVHSFIMNARAQLASQGTSVIGVYPGPIETDMAADLEMDKFPPEQVAKATLNALENDIEDVFTDEFSQTTYAAYREDPKAVERNMRESILSDQEAA